MFAIHFVAYLPRFLRSPRAASRATSCLPGAGVRTMLLTAAVGGGAVLAIALLPAITSWRA